MFQGYLGTSWLASPTSLSCHGIHNLNVVSTPGTDFSQWRGWADNGKRFDRRNICLHYGCDVLIFTTELITYGQRNKAVTWKERDTSVVKYASYDYEFHSPLQNGGSDTSGLGTSQPGQARRRPQAAGDWLPAFSSHCAAALLLQGVTSGVLLPVLLSTQCLAPVSGRGSRG